MIRDSGYGPKLVREYNELNILRFIKNEGPISRADLAKRYKISKAAVSEIISHLLGQEYIREIGVGKSTSLGGRKPILLEFNPRAGYVIGVEIKRDHAWVALGDLNANICSNSQVSFESGAPLKKIVEKIFAVIDRHIQKEWIKRARAMGIGVAIPGLINYHTGKIQESDTLKNWQGFPLKREFEERYGIETIIENDVKAKSLGECRFGNGKNVNNIVYLWIGDGLGAGIIINGELYRGVSASAGEIGYYELGCFINNFDEYRLLYSGQANFGDILSGKVLIEGAHRGLKNGYKWQLKHSEITIKDIIRQAEQNNPLALELLREYGSLVGIVCINLINTLNPEVILIDGHIITENRILLNFIKDKVKKDVLRTPVQAVRIKIARLKDNAGILGAMGLILDDLFYMDRLNIVKYRTVFG